jgi:hypothetical protein
MDPAKNNTANEVVNSFLIFVIWNPPNIKE